MGILKNGSTYALQKSLPRPGTHNQIGAGEQDMETVYAILNVQINSQDKGFLPRHHHYNLNTNYLLQFLDKTFSHVFALLIHLYSFIFPLPF